MFGRTDKLHSAVKDGQGCCCAKSDSHAEFCFQHCGLSSICPRHTRNSDQNY